MRRREFITLLGGAAATWPLAARAQRIDRARQIGVLQGLAPTDPEYLRRVGAFRRGLQELAGPRARTSRCALIIPKDDRTKCARLPSSWCKRTSTSS